MRIGVDVFSFDKPGANYGVGPGAVAWNLLEALTRLAPELTFVVFGNRDNAGFIPVRANVHAVISPYNNQKRLLRILHEQLWLPSRFRKHKLDLLYCLGNNIPYRLGSKSILLVHDLMWKYYRDRGDRSAKNLYFSLTVPSSLRRAKAIIAVSEATRQDLVKQMGVPVSKVHVVYNGPCSTQVVLNEEDSRRFAVKYPAPFLFTLTTSMPHKNLPVLLEAFLKLKQEAGIREHLVIAGQLKGSFHQKTFQYIAEHGLQEVVHIAGFISEEEKTWCYANATAVVYPSLYEGFGLPVLEAMAAGVPVVASKAASIPEVGGDACLYFDPTNAAELSTQILRVLQDESLRKELIDKGIQQAGKFSWDRAARETLAILQQL